jgi:hypothetical protein
MVLGMVWCSKSRKIRQSLPWSVILSLRGNEMDKDQDDARSTILRESREIQAMDEN